MQSGMIVAFVAGMGEEMEAEIGSAGEAIIGAEIKTLMEVGLKLSLPTVLGLGAIFNFF